MRRAARGPAMMRIWLGWLSVSLAVAVLAGCSASSSSSAARAGGVLGSECAPDRHTGEAGRSFTVQIRAAPAVSEGRTRRRYVIHVPLGYVSSAPTPLVLYFHGAGQSAADADTSSGWSELADRDRFLVVYPQGLPFGVGGPVAWASAGPIDYGIDDLAFVRAVLTQVEGRYCVARGEVFAVGMSSGGGMAGYLACALSDQIAAAAPVEGNHYTLTKLGCRPRRPVALLEVHGTADAVVPYQGIPASVDPEWPLPSIANWVSTWAHLDRCRIRHVATTPVARETLFIYTRCASGSGVELYRLGGSGHVYPATLSGKPADTIIYRFFIEHRRR